VVHRFVASTITFKLVQEELRLLNNYKSYRCSNLVLHVMSVATTHEKFLSPVLYPNFQKVTRNVFRIEFPIKWYIDTDDDKLQSNNSGKNI
jgi:hypothetical protein